MDFQRARTKEQIGCRVDEILNACADLYSELDFEEITLKMISDRTSLSRTTMYGYYKTKEEIFLDLLNREYLSWNDALSAAVSKKPIDGREAFAKMVADSLHDKNIFLRLLSIQQTIIERNSSEEQLIRFKTESGVIFHTLEQGLKKAFPKAEKELRDQFVVQLLIYLLGFYPFTHPTRKQLTSLRAAGIEMPEINSAKLLYNGIYHLTEGL